MTEKAVILARGLGKRMRRPDDSASLAPEQEAVAASGVKAMIPIGRPFLDYVISALADAGYRQLCLVVAPDHEMVRRYYTEQVQPRRVEITFAVQQEPKGTADAVAAAAEFAGDDPFLAINSDNYYPTEALQAIRQQHGCAVALFEQGAMLAGSNIAPERIRSFAVGLADEKGNLERIVEKPDEETLSRLPRPLWLSMNCWRFGPSIFEACRHIVPSPRGELEIPDAVQYAIDHLNEVFRVLHVRAAVLDMTSRSDIASVASQLQAVEVNL